MSRRKYTSFHFSPRNNRSILMPGIPKGEPYVPAPRSMSRRYPFPPVAEERLDRARPYVQINTGLHRKEARTGDQDRPYSVYVPDGMHSKGAAALVFPPSGMDGEAFVAWENWKELADDSHMALLILESRNWKAEETEQVFDYANEVVKREFGQRLTVDICESCIYPMGLGDGARMAVSYALTYSATYGALAADGDCSVDPELLEVLEKLPSDGVDTRKKTQIPLPAFLIDREGRGTDTFLYMKKLIHAREDGLSNQYGKVYLEQARPGAYFVNEQPVSQVWLCSGESAGNIGREEWNRAMVEFVSRYSRWGGFGNNHLRLRRTLEETGVVRVERQIGGLARYWDVYVPSCCEPDSGKTWPLVVAVHGLSCNSEYFEHTSDWQRIAEERGFFVVFASGYPANDGIARFPVPHWDAEVEGGKEELYFRELLDYMEATYPVDRKRIYAAGHSNGSRMVQRLMRAMPERFAAFGPTGALGGWSPEEVKPLDVTVPVPVWFMMGEYDVSDSRLTEGGLAWKTLETCCMANGVDFTADNWYDNGHYHTLVLYDGKHVPMVQYTVMRGCPHTYTAEMAQMTWDLFFCHFEREEDGSIRYRG